MGEKIDHLSFLWVFKISILPEKTNKKCLSHQLICAVQQFMECQWTWNYDLSHFLIEEMADDVYDEDDGDC